jgi:hypothetical protein
MEADNNPKQMRSQKQGVHRLHSPHIAVFGYALHIRQFMLSSGIVKYARIFTAAVAKILLFKAEQQLWLIRWRAGHKTMQRIISFATAGLKIGYRHNVAGRFQPLA